MLQKIKVLFKERWKYFFGGYIIGYIYAILLEGVSHWYDFIPIKVICILCAILLGNAAYYGIVEKPNIIRAFYMAIKLTVPVVIIIILCCFLQNFIYRKWGIDIYFLLGWPKLL